eukprot:3090240-Prymnesium_polylepis.1
MHGQPHAPAARARAPAQAPSVKALIPRDEMPTVAPLPAADDPLAPADPQQQHAASSPSADGTSPEAGGAA